LAAPIKRKLLDPRALAAETVSPPRGGRRTLSAIGVVFAERSRVFIPFLFECPVYTMRVKMAVGILAAICSTGAR
jgi:hypothetical protein